MKKFSLVMLFMLFAAQSALAVNYGPASNALGKPGITLGGGYSNSTMKWGGGYGTAPAAAGMEHLLGDLKTEQQIGYLELGIGLSTTWRTYARVGGSTFSGTNMFISSSTDKVEEALPFASMGVSGLFYNGRIFKIGPFAQGTYYFKDLQDRTYDGYGTLSAAIGPEWITERMEFEDFWSASGGVTAELDFDGGLLYGGLFAYDTNANYATLLAGRTSGAAFYHSESISEEDNLGTFVGIRWLLNNGFVVEVEAEKRSSASIGANLTYCF